MSNTIKLSEQQLNRIELAQTQSKTQQCTLHVNAVMVLNDAGELALFGIMVSDFYHQHSTIKSFKNGVEQ